MLDDSHKKVYDIQKHVQNFENILDTLGNTRG